MKYLTLFHSLREVPIREESITHNVMYIVQGWELYFRVRVKVRVNIRVWSFQVFHYYAVVKTNINAKAAIYKKADSPNIFHWSFIWIACSSILTTQHNKTKVAWGFEKVRLSMLEGMFGVLWLEIAALVFSLNCKVAFLLQLFFFKKMLLNKGS